MKAGWLKFDTKPGARPPSPVGYAGTLYRGRTTEQPDVDVHIGTLTKCPQCAVTFDLVPAHRING